MKNEQQFKRRAKINATPEDDVLITSLSGLIQLATLHVKEGNTREAKEIANYIKEKLDNLREN